MVLDHKLLMVAVGMIVGLPVCASMLLGALLLVYVAGPAGLAAGAVREPSQAWLQIGIWIGAPMLISAGLLSFALEWRTVLRSFRGLGASTSDIGRRTEVPRGWFVWGALIAGVAVVGIANQYFGIPWALGAVAVLLSFALSIVACRVTGETDQTPVGALGKVTQLVYGILMPQNAAANLMTACLSASTASSSADLLTDLKSGHLLGASPRRQFIAQLLGIFSGTAATVLGYYLLVPDALALTGSPGRPPAFPAPAAQSWLAMAMVFRLGLGSLHPAARAAILWGTCVGLGLVVVRALVPGIRRWLPSPTGLGLGLMMPFQYPLSLFIGSIVAAVWSKRRPAGAERYIVALASGAIAGESLISVAVAAINTLFL